jgi:hypothetical protein
MMRLLRRRAAALRGVSFCDSCAQVCTADCRAATHRDRARTSAFYLGHGR